MTNTEFRIVYHLVTLLVCFWCLEQGLLIWSCFVLFESNTNDKWHLLSGHVPTGLLKYPPVVIIY